MLPSPHHPAFNDYYCNPKNRGVITGRVVNLPEGVDREKLIEYSAVAFQRTDQENLWATIAENGSFLVELPFSAPVQEVWFSVGVLFHACLLVRTAIHVEIDYAALIRSDKSNWTHPGVIFSGPDKELCEIRGQQIGMVQENGINYFGPIQDQDAPIEDRQAKVDSILNKLQAIDEKLLVGRSDQDAEIIRNERMSEYWGNSSVLYWKHPMPALMREQYLAHNPMAVSNGVTDFYYYFSISILFEARREVRDKLGVSNMEAFSHPLATTVFLEKVDEAFSPSRADLMKLYLEVTDPIANLDMLEAMEKTMTVRWCKERLTSKLKKRRAEIKELTASLKGKVDTIEKIDLGTSLGHLDFGADLYVSEATTGQALLDQLRGVFPGKAIYLDLWAVWCGPCIQELPFSKKAHEAAANLPIEFVYLCTESGGDQEKWQNLIASHQVPGTHLFVPEAPHSELLKLLLGRGYPTYVLIKPDGTVVHDVPRPTGLDREKLEKMLGE